MKRISTFGFAVLVSPFCLGLACGGSKGPTDDDGSVVQSGGRPSVGGTASGGTAPGIGGAPSSGGAPPGTTGGAPSSGGATTACQADPTHAYQGSPASVPGTVEAEDFDIDGFSDTTPGNEGATYRTDVDVDIKELGGGHAIGWMAAGEWLEYTISVAESASYSLTVHAGAVDPGRTLELSACGRDLTTIEVPMVADWGQMGTVETTVQLQAGLQVLRVNVGASDFIDFDSIDFGLASSGTGGTGAGSGGETAAGGANGSGGQGPGAGGSNGEIPRFVGNITTYNTVDTDGFVYSDYWDQITPENAGKWGSVQGSASSAPNWTTLDAIHDYSVSKGIVFKQHAFVWGTQQPGGSISEANVKDWMNSFCERYPGTRIIDVVNEPPPHTTPSYVNAIGGGTNGNWQWITNSFIWAREACPDAILILNDYNNIEWSNDNQHFIDIVKTVVQNGGPIDAVGAQAHDLDNGSVSFQTVERLLNKLHTDTGLPVYITELDISTTDDQQQLNLYKQYFPFFWEKDFIPGITIWGWIYGKTWNQASNSGLIRSGQPRPAMEYLMNELGRPVP